MNVFAKRLVAFSILALALGLAALGAESREAVSPPAKPTIVLVHGAFADSSSWNAVVAQLQSRGYTVVAVANPLRGVKSDAAGVEALVRSLHGHVVLVGHSYGGQVISNVGNANHKIKALVYVSAFAPQAGESAGALAARFPGSSLASALLPPVRLPDGSNDLYIDPSKFHAQFAADVPAAEAASAAVAQRPVTDKALNEPSGTPTWASTPSWFIYGGMDRNIPPAALDFMAQRARSRRTVVIDGASHAVMLSHPYEVARLIVQAAESH
ncbi:alpha/beta fold hydrolase [Frateuria sp. STR12]|uniref:alpha/beta fold hydrolase n=1 Tax=Frateuria hangzhouensis TaxID=2995589 RepID=UPI002260D6B0|nr:alpha/beta hydrolase [Frateuria sp. STR12]MCX7512267.1 alpha/beta hydrolase [Frateuria sp. STR12]